MLTPAVFRASGSGDQVAHDVVNGHRLDNGDSITFVALARELVHRESRIVPDREPRFGHVQAEVIVGDIARKSPARVNGARNFPNYGEVKFPSLAGGVIRRRFDRGLRFLAAVRDV